MDGHGSGRLIVKRLAKGAALLAVLYFVGWELARNIATVDWGHLRFRPGYVIGAMACMLAATVLATTGFRMLLLKASRAPGWAILFGVSCLSRLGKYIPGKLASIAGGAYLLRRYGVSVEQALSVMILESALVVMVGLLAASPLIVVEPFRSRIPHAWLVCAVVLSVGLACIHPKVFLPTVNFLLRRLKRPVLRTFPRMRDYMGPVLLYTAEWFFLGLSLWMLLRSLAPSLPQGAVLICTSASALATTLGFLALFAPGGLGVREGILLLALGTFVDAGVASVVTVLSRLAQMLLEVILASAGALLLKYNPPRDSTSQPAGQLGGPQPGG